MSTSIVAPPGKVHKIDDFDSHLVVDKKIGASKSPFIHFIGRVPASGEAKYEWVFRCPISELNEQRASGFWPETKEGTDYYATTIYIGLNYNSKSLGEAYLFTQMRVSVQVYSSASPVTLD